MLKKLINNTSAAISARQQKIKKSVNDFLTSLKPTYAVEVEVFTFIPGVPVNGKSDRHQFGNGELDAAKGFYDKVVNKTAEIKMAPAEIRLIKGKKKVIEFRHFGPIEDLKKLKKKSA